MNLKEELKTIESFLSNLSPEAFMEMLKRNGYKEDNKISEETIATNPLFMLKKENEALKSKVEFLQDRQEELLSEIEDLNRQVADSENFLLSINEWRT